MTLLMSERKPVFNRELSWLAFNERVFEEARDASNPLLERVRFATIVASNLDEFFMVRVAAIKGAVAEGRRPPSRLRHDSTRAAQRDSRARRDDVERAAHAGHGHAHTSARCQGHPRPRRLALPPQSRAAVAAYFQTEVLPALTPLAIDVERPFPMLSALSLNVAFWLSPADEERDRRLAVVQVPRACRGSYGSPASTSRRSCGSTTSCAPRARRFFRGRFVGESAAFRLARDAELELDDEGESFLEAVERSLRQRRRNDVVRLEIAAEASADAVDHLARLVGRRRGRYLSAPGIHRCPRPGRDLRSSRLRRAAVSAAAARRHDAAGRTERHLLGDRSPRHSAPPSLRVFRPVVAFVEAAADDPDVLAIKQTLYRTSGDSPIVAALTRAADEGKQVTALVELMARFDESRNIRWARRLEEMGAHVIYGIRHYKVHSKICLVVRRTKEACAATSTWVRATTTTAQRALYTDMGLLTSDPVIAADASASGVPSPATRIRRDFASWSWRPRCCANAF
jgi:polyphosphate kinase